ncbi:MAG: type II secretion system protein GspC [Polyangiaceae bacterium]
MDAIAKRYFPLIVCTLLAIIALFQAKGIGALVGGQLEPPSAAAPAKTTARSAPSARAAKIKSVTAQPILSRNAFDSKTGPLDKVVAPTPEPTAPPAPDPEAAAEDPACPSGSVVLIADSEDPAWSFAMIRTAAGAKMRRVGDEVDGQVVKAITWDRVWLASGTGRCQLKLDIAANKTASASPTPAPTPTPAAPPPAPGKDPGIDPGAVRKVSENEYVVQRSAMDKANGLGGDLKKGSRLVPNKGIRLSKVDANSLLGQVGIQSGDIVKTINGFDMTDLDKTAEGYSRLKSAREVTLALDRNGTPVTISIKIE